mmetsp:Transcript_7569/g.11499  ORF Transcript_7569/g.11499 Transcript_7569/m.11499 type:complete len:80 (+) Transcript_7569:2-241(+)
MGFQNLDRALCLISPTHWMLSMVPIHGEQHEAVGEIQPLETIYHTNTAPSSSVRRDARDKGMSTKSINLPLIVDNNSLK